MSNYYFICGHGKILETRFIPKKKQTVVFFSLPGDETYLGAGSRLLFEINKISEKCIDKKKREQYELNKKKCRHLDLIGCQKSLKCRPSPVPKRLNKKRTCLPKIDYQIEALKLLSEDRHLKKNCRDKYQCRFCDEINDEFNYDIRIWDTDRINLSGKGIPDLEISYAPLINSHPDSNKDFLFKYGIYPLPNQELDRFKKEFGNGLIDNWMKRNLGFGPGVTIQNNSEFKQSLINESFKGSINYQLRNNLIQGKTRYLSEILADLPEGVYFILSCRFSIKKKKFYLLPDNPIFYNKENSFGINQNTNIIYFKDDTINRLNSEPINLPNCYWTKKFIINTRDISKYTVGSYFRGDHNIKIIKKKSDTGSKIGQGQLELEEKKYLKDYFNKTSLVFVYIYNFIRESYNLLKLGKFGMHRESIYLLNSDDINYDPSSFSYSSNLNNIFIKCRVIDFQPNALNYILNSTFKNIIEYKTFMYQPSYIFCQGILNGEYQYLRININKMKQSKFFYAEILDNYDELIESNQKPRWKNFISDKSYSILGVGNSKTNNNFINYLTKQECCKYKDELIFLQDNEGIGDEELGLYSSFFFDELVKDLQWIKSEHKGESIIKKPNELANFIKKQMKNVSYINYQNLINYNPMYEISDKMFRNNVLVDLKCYPFLYDDEIIGKKYPEDITDYHHFNLTEIPSFDLDGEFPHFRNGTRLAIFCNEENILLPINNEDTDKYLIPEWTKLSRFREYADKAIIGTVIDYWFFKIDHTDEYLNIQNFLKLILDIETRKNKLVTFIRLPFPEHISIGKHIWLRPKNDLNPEVSVKNENLEYIQYLITKTYLRGINDPPCIFYRLKIINVIDKTIVYFQPTNPEKYSFLFGEEIQNVYSPEITLQREDSYKNLNLFK